MATEWWWNFTTNNNNNKFIKQNFFAKFFRCRCCCCCYYTIEIGDSHKKRDIPISDLFIVSEIEWEKERKFHFFLSESINWIVINVCRSRNRFFNDDPVYCLPLVVVVVVIVAGTFLLTCQCCCCPKVVNWIVLGLHFYLFIFDQILSIHDWNQKKKLNAMILMDRFCVINLLLSVLIFFLCFFLWLFCIVSVCSFLFIIYEFWLFLWISNIQNKCDQKD